MEFFMAALDCLIVGYHDIALSSVLQRARSTRGWSGAYENLRTNSLPFGSTRIDYMELLNRALASGRPNTAQLHVANMPALGAWYLHSYLQKLGFSSNVVNFFTRERDRIAMYLKQGVRAVAITTTFYVEPLPVREIVQFVRSCDSATKIIVGGPYIFNLFEQLSEQPATLEDVLREIGADIAVVDSQGELTLARILHHLRGDPVSTEIAVTPAPRTSRSNSLRHLNVRTEPVLTRDLRGIPNLAFFSDGALVQTPREIESNDMDIFSEDWSSVTTGNFVPTAVTRTARSCAFSCAFCRYPIIAGPLNLKSLQTIERQFDHFQDSGVKQLVIIDDTFNVPLPRFKDLLRLMIRKNYPFEWFAYFRAANADDACFDLMAESRCGGVFLGIESGDQTILNNMHKSSRVDKYCHAIRELNKRGIITFASLIVGFPGETAATIDNTVRFIEEAQPQYYRAELYYHGTNTPIQKSAETFGITGAGYSWRHSTMTWKEACAHIISMYSSITTSTVLPLYNFDFWCIPYLCGCGMSKQQIHSFVRRASSLLLEDLNHGNVDVTSRMPDLAAALS
jgi:radical SAM superfamily enzyme YgiQ (UPF0313 family)